MKVLIANFTKNLVKLNIRQVFATADNHLDIIAESNITHAEMVSLTTNS